MDPVKSAKNERTIQLERIDIETTARASFRIKLRVNNEDINVHKRGQDSTWIPPRTVELPSTCQLTVIVKAGRTYVGISLGKIEVQTNIDGNDITKAFWDSNDATLSVTRNLTFGSQPMAVIFRFRPSPTYESTRAALHKLQKAMKDFKPLMSKSFQKNTDRALKFAMAFSEMNSFAKAAAGFLNATFQLLKEQQKCDDMVSDLSENVGRILPCIKRVQGIKVGDNGALEEIIEEIYEVLLESAKFICNYVQHTPIGRATKGLISNDDQETIDELSIKLRKLVEDFDRNIVIDTREAVGKTEFFEEESFLRSRLHPLIKAGYNRERRCMENTRLAILGGIVDWASKSSEGNSSSELSPELFWLYGMPGIGKTCIANSLCSQLHDMKVLGGSFFCRRDDPDRCEPKYLLSTLMFELAGAWSPYRKMVVETLRNDSKLNPDSASFEIFVKIFKDIQGHPPHPLVLVVDALDECGSTLTRSSVLKALFDASSQVPWLRIIITSRPEYDIGASFQSAIGVHNHISQNLDTHEDAETDIKLFAQTKFAQIASRSHVSDNTLWEQLVGEIVKRARGLFIFIEMVWRLVMSKGKFDPIAFLQDIIRDTTGVKLDDQKMQPHENLYNLYTTAIRSQVEDDTEMFRQIAGVIIAVASYRPLCDETVAIIAELKLGSVKTCVEGLSSLLDRDTGAIRVRHLSIIDYLTSPRCPSEFRVDLEQAHLQVGLACLKSMIRGLKFNICKLENSLLSNDKVEDLDRRVQENIPDILQYSCVYWYSHLCQCHATDQTRKLLGELFDEARPLYWLEVLSVMGRVGIGITALRQILSWPDQYNYQYIQRIEETLRFLLAFHTPIAMSAPHIYISALPFTPMESPLWKDSIPKFHALLRVQTGRMERWPSRPLTWLGHSDDITCIAFSPGNRYIVSGSDDHTIRLWDVATGIAVGEPWEGHKDQVNTLAYSPMGLYVVSGSEDCTIRMWDVYKGTLVDQPWEGHTGRINSLAYSPDGRFVVSGSDDCTIRMWDAETGRMVGEPWEGHEGYVNCIAYSPDGCYVISGSSDMTIRKWDASNGSTVGEPWRMCLPDSSGAIPSLEEEVAWAYASPVEVGSRVPLDAEARISWLLSRIEEYSNRRARRLDEEWRGERRWIRCIAYSPDGQHITTGHSNGIVQIWNIELNKAVAAWKGHRFTIWSVCYSPDGLHIASASMDEHVQIWEAATGTPVGKSLSGHFHGVRAVSWSRDGRYIVSGSEDKAIRLWDAVEGKAIGQQWHGQSAWVHTVACSPDGRHIAAGSEDAIIQIWESATGQAVGTPWRASMALINCVNYSPDGTHVISGSFDGKVRIWDPASGTVTRELVKAHQWICCVAYSPDGRQIAASDTDGTIQIWNAVTGEEVVTWHTNQKWLRFAYSPDGCFIVSTTYTDRIRKWDAVTGNEVSQFSGIPTHSYPGSVCFVAYSPNGHYIVSSGEDGVLRKWDAETGEEIGDPWKGHRDHVGRIAFSPDGRYVISISWDKTIRKWDVGTGEQVGEPWTGHTNTINGLALSPDGQYVVSGDTDNTIRIWEITTNPTHHRRLLLRNNSPSRDESESTTLSVNLPLDPNGWLHHPDGGLLFWVPEDSRNGLECPAVLTIPTDGPNRVVRLDLDNFRYGTSWNDIAIQVSI